MADIIEEKNKKEGEVILNPVEENPLLIEERPCWEEFRGGEIDETGEYKKPTQEQVAMFDRRLERLSEVFHGADFDWLISGALNISLYKNDYIRNHKDIDVDVFYEDLAKLEKHLKETGFAIFLDFEQDQKRLMRPITESEIRSLPTNIQQSNLMIRKVGERNKSSEETDEPYMDLHIRQRDENGDVISPFGLKIPEEYFKSIPKKLANGKEINLSQPIIVAYYKMHQDRGYDLIDLEKLKPYLKEEDVDVLRNILAKEVEARDKWIKTKLVDIWSSLSPIIGLTKDPEVIKNAILCDKDVQQRREDPDVLKYVSGICDFILGHPDLSLDDFIEQSMLSLGSSKMFADKLKILED
jgi:hypothetical protein